MADTKISDYKKVRKEGNTRVLAVGKCLPPDWTIVKVEVVEHVEGEYVLLRIEKVV